MPVVSPPLVPKTPFRLSLSYYVESTTYESAFAGQQN